MTSLPERGSRVGAQVVLVAPAGQMTCWAAKSMVNAAGWKPVLAAAWREVSAGSGPVSVTP